MKEILVVPDVSPVTSPVAALIVALTALLLLHVPPPEEVSVAELPMHIPVAPVMAPGAELTERVRVTRHPVPSRYWIVVVPDPAPAVTKPVDALIDATPGVLLLHTPPVGVDVSVAVVPEQTVDAPAIAPGRAFTVTCFTVIQPFRLYETVAVPLVIPKTTPVPASTVTLPVLLLLHTPPPGVVFKVVFAPTHIDAVPLIAAGSGLTETFIELLQPVVAT
jgi:hypothetical protein